MTSRCAIFWSTSDQLCPQFLEESLREFPSSLSDRMTAKVDAATRATQVLAYSLLRKALQKYRNDPDGLKALTFGMQGQPLYRGKPEVSISHTGTGAFAAVSDCGRLGLDVEQIRSLAIEEIDIALNERDRQLALELSSNPAPPALRVWVRKEAVLKGVGCGLTLPPNEVFLIDKDTAVFQERAWYLSEFSIGGSFVGCIASQIPALELEISNPNIG